MQYLAYSQPPTSVVEAHKADFLEPGVDAVVQIKHNIIEVHALVPSGLRLAVSGQIHGVVLKSVPLRLRNHATSALAVLTTAYQLFVVVFDKQNAEIKTLASHSVYERGANKSVDLVALLAGSPTPGAGNTAPTPYLLVHAFQGLIRVITLAIDDASEEKDAKGGEEDALDLSSGFTTRIPELLLNSIAVLPSSSALKARLATIHSDRFGERIFHTHAINFAQKRFDTFEAVTSNDTFASATASAFLLETGTTLADAESQLMIPVRAQETEGVIVIGSELAVYFSTSPASSTKSRARRRSSASGIPVSSMQSAAMQLDEVPEGSATSPRSGSNAKGKGRSEDIGILSASPTEAEAGVLASSPTAKQGTSTRRRSSASGAASTAAQAGSTASPTSPRSLDPRAGNKRKLSDAATSSGRGKGSASKSKLGHRAPVECKLPISEYVAFCQLETESLAWILVDSWGQAVILRLRQPEPQSEILRSADSGILASSPPGLATSPPAGSFADRRRNSRGSFSHSRSSAFTLSAEQINAGRVSSPTSLLDLGGGFLFVGSHCGDSLLVRLVFGSAEARNSIAHTPAGNGAMQVDDDSHVVASPSARIEVVNAYTNLAPIVDFCVVETDDGKGPSHLVACSGGKSDGTLRIVRHGVSIAEIASLEMEDVQRVHTLSCDEKGQRLDLLAISSVNETRLLSFRNDCDVSIEELDNLSGFKLSAPTLLACSHAGHAYQVTSFGVSGSSSSWQAPSGSKVTLASALDGYALLALSGGELVLLQLSSSGQIEQVARQRLEQEAACVNLARIPGGAGVAIAGLWNTQAVQIMDMSSLSTLDSFEVGNSFLLRSVLCATLQSDEEKSLAFLFVGLGDGSLVSYSIGQKGTSVAVDQSSRKAVTLGSRPITLTDFKTAGNAETGLSSMSAVLAVSDRSTVISCTGGKLAFASVNTKNIVTAAALSSAAFPDSLLIATPTSLSIGRVDQLEKLDVQTLRLGEDAPRRVCYSKALRAYGVVFLRETLDRSTGEVTRVSSFKILGENDFEVLFEFELDPTEEGRSVASISMLQADGSDFHTFVVGSAFIVPGEDESQWGNIRVFASAGEGHFEQAVDTKTCGAVHSLAQMPDGKFAASQNSDIKIYSWRGPEVDRYHPLEIHAGWGSAFIAYNMAVKGNLICVVDPLRSASLVRYQEGTNYLLDVGKEFSAYGLFAAAFLKDDVDEESKTNEHTIIASDLDLNMFTAKNTPIPVTSSSRNSSAHREDIYTLKTQATMHTGDVVNKFTTGSLVPAFSRNAGGPTPQVIFCTSVGSIGMVASLPSDASSLLSNVERNLRKYLATTTGNLNIGSLSHSDWRAFKAEYRNAPAAGFIDGTMVENLLSLTSEQVEQVMQGSSEFESIARDSKQEVIQLIEELQRMH